MNKQQQAQLQEALERFKQDTQLQARVQIEFERFHRDTRYYEEHHQELLEQYPEQWVAIHNEQVVGAGPDYDQLLSEVKAQGIPLTLTLFEFLTRKPEVWIL